MRIFLLILIFVVCISDISLGIPPLNLDYKPPATKPNNIQAIVEDANDFLGFPYYKEKLITVNKSLNLVIWNELRYQTMVYGNPFGDTKFYKGFTESRYLGYTKNNEPYTNLRFPHDEFNRNISFDKRNWINKPWDNNDFINTYKKIHHDFNINRSEFNGTWAKKNIEKNIEQGMKDYYGAYVDGTKKDWYNNVHILQPPTWWADGRGEAWHKTGSGSNTRYWYITIPIRAERFVPRIPDYRVVNINPGTDGLIEEGQIYDKASVTFGVNDNFRKDIAKARVTLKLNGVIAIDNREIEIPKGKTLTMPFNYQGQAKNITFTATITPVDPVGDTNHKNNSLTVVRYHKYIDLAADSLTSKSPIPVNTPSTASVRLRNLGTITSTFDVNYYLNQTLVKSEVLTLGKNGSILRTFNFQSPGTAGSAQLRVTADPHSRTKDINRTNNTAIRNIVIKASSPVPTKCNHNTFRTATSWTETYYIITGYHTKYYDLEVWDDDKEEYVTLTYSYTDFTDPIWEPRRVTYNESLTAIVKVNTKQGIPTDRNNPKESDRESRGSWEIIPWARSKGLDPNEVTRAGYGFEITVDTTYWNDYETKVPRGLENTAAPLGGTLYGPIRVRVELWDSNNHFAGRYNLETVSGTPGAKVIKWALPEVKRDLSNGQSFYDRKHYTDVLIPDGDYDVVVFIEGVGKNGLQCCLQETVKIHGDMYDDIYTRPGT